ncbi:MAG: phosphatidylserine decarboxylase [Fimbriimonadales bacterium]|nr:MAG: phosphatidylserine decarboxylase [Fimbriimonadales bacterium]
MRIPNWLKWTLGAGAAIAGANWFLRKVWFYRDPVRIPPTDPDLILAPCDGKVVYIRPVSADGAVFAEKLGRPIPITEITRAEWDGVSPEGWLIGIYMSPLDVHYNYAPIAGTVRKIVYTPARANLPMVDLWEYVSMTWLRRAVDLLGKRYHLENERQTIFIENEHLRLAMVEIADKFVNKITTYVQEGQCVRPAQKVSFIERGSQVDLLLFTRDVEILTHTGAQVYGGQTPVARFIKPDDE